MSSRPERPAPPADREESALASGRGATDDGRRPVGTSAPAPGAAASASASASTLPGDAERAAAAGRLRPALGGSLALDRLAGLASQLLGTTSAYVSLLADAQTIAGSSGLPDEISAGSELPLTDALCAVTVATRQPVTVTDARADARVATLPAVTSGLIGAYLGVPIRADQGRVVGALCVFAGEPRPWSDSDVSLLSQLATSAAAELELSALGAEYQTAQVKWELAIDAAGIGTFDWDLATGDLEWDDKLIELFGYARDTFDRSIEGFTARVHEEDRARVAAALQGAIDACGDYEAEYRIVLPGGATRWVT